MKKILLTILLSFSFLFSQNYIDALTPFYGFKGSQSIGVGVGNATVAGGQVIPEFTSNPANLGLQRFKTVELTYTSSEFNSGSNNLPQSSFGTFSLIYPIKVYRGSIVLATSLEKEKEFALSYQDVDDYGDAFKQRNEGKMKNWHFAVASEIAENLFVGADIIIPNGNIDISREYPNVSPDTMGFAQNVDYNGISATIGMFQKISKNFNWGMSVDLPRKININDDFTYNDGYDLGKIEYSSTRPLSIHLGASALFKYFNLFYEAEWTDWKNMEFSSDDLYSSDITDINEEIENYLSQTISHHFGGALHMPFLPLHLYGGYQILPEPHSDKTRNIISGGFSYLIKQQISIHGAYQRYDWDYETNNGSIINETWDQIILGMSLHF
ncbi:MAG: hypothetical protein U9R41_03535 [Candidatus Marinimicrobia bacterium]|nr:hypothetical protein [Candidatus Neomarinimicrobiota bacterium]